jgi:hypothetical protein
MASARPLPSWMRRRDPKDPISPTSIRKKSLGVAGDNATGGQLFDREFPILEGAYFFLTGWSKRRRVASEFGVWSWWPGRSEVPFRLSSTASIFCRLAAVYHSTYSALLL